MPGYVLPSSFPSPGSRRLRVLTRQIASSPTAGAAEGEVALVVGAGKGVSASCARLFRREGMKVAVAARSPASARPALKALVDQHGISSYQCDATDPAAVKSLFAQVAKDLGRFPDLVLYNLSGDESMPNTKEAFTSGKWRGPVEGLDPETVKGGLMASVYGAFLVAQQAAIGMMERKSGSILFTGASASYKGYPNSSSFAMGKFALTGLVQSLARELGPKGVHVCHFPLDGGVRNTHRESLELRADPEDLTLSPEDIAQTYFFVHKQPRSTWSYELQLRPWKEKW